MTTRLLALFNLRPGTSTQEYEDWARSVDLPTVLALSSITGFEVFRITGRMGSSEPAPYAYGEILNIADMEQFGRDVSSETMQAVAAKFNGMADVVFLTTEKLER